MTPDNPQKNSSHPKPDFEHPWPGLHPYTEDAQEFFFGRDEEVRKIFMKVRDHALTILYGKSGWGKSSLLRAGLVPKLKVEAHRPVVVRLDYSTGMPSLIDQTKDALRSVAPNLPFDTESTLWEILNRLAVDSNEQEQRALNLEKAPPVLIFDQFEEIFAEGMTRRENWEQERVEWFTQIADLLENRRPETLLHRIGQNRELIKQYSPDVTPARVILSLREDYLSDLESWKQTLPSLMSNRIRLEPLRGPEALEVVMRPASLREHPIISDTEVGKQIVQKAASQELVIPFPEINTVPPPFLSLICEQLNEARISANEQEITHDLVTKYGRDILNKYYENSFEGRPVAIRHYIEDFLVSETGCHRNALVRGDFISVLQKKGVSDPAHHLDELIARRMLVMEERGGQLRVELTHDILAELAKNSRNKRKEHEAGLEAERKEREARLEAERKEKEASLERKEQEAKIEALQQRVKRRRGMIMTSIFLILVFASLAAFGWHSSYKAEKGKQLLDSIKVAAHHRLFGDKQLREDPDRPCFYSILKCGPRGGNPSQTEQSCDVPLVSFDESDKDAYDAVACEFFEKRGIRVSRITCKEGTFFTDRVLVMISYPGGVFTWMTGQSTVPFGDALYRFDEDLWRQTTTNIWEPVKDYLYINNSDKNGLYDAIPFKFYPWAIYYNKEVIRKRGPFKHLHPPAPDSESEEWTVPETWRELIETAEEMQAKNIPPFAFSFGEYNEWSAIPTFDLLYVRLHGYRDHKALFANQLPMAQMKSQLIAVFEKWAKLVPFYTPSWKNDTVQGSTRDLEQGEAAMYLTGSFFLKHIKNTENENNFGLFDVPIIDLPGSNNPIGDRGAIDTPVDTFVATMTTDDNALHCAKELLKFLATEKNKDAFDKYNEKNDYYLPTNREALKEMACPPKYDTPQYQAANLVWKSINKTCEEDETNPQKNDPADNVKIAGFTDRRKWGNAEDLTPAFDKFLHAVYYAQKDPNKIRKAIDDAVTQLLLISKQRRSRD
jgi:hypothetical protein